MNCDVVCLLLEHKSMSTDISIYQSMVRVITTDLIERKEKCGKTERKLIRFLIDQINL
jgi:hypothetical protein